MIILCCKQIHFENQVIIIVLQFWTLKVERSFAFFALFFSKHIHLLFDHSIPIGMCFSYNRRFVVANVYADVHMVVMLLFLKNNYSFYYEYIDF